NISQANQVLALEALNNEQVKNEKVAVILAQRERLEEVLPKLSIVTEVLPSNSNFLLVRFEKAEELFKYLTNNGVVVRNRTKEKHCADCLRITIGTPEENDRLLTLLNAFIQ
ncbi:MAG: histidinol-phosphate aminotransferase, partial [Marinoscillum sp.]